MKATALILSYLQQTNPSANVSIINVTPSQYSGSWHVFASVISNATSPCPSYSVYTYDYPAFRLVNSTNNRYTNNCQIYSLPTSGPFIISSAPIAITWASTRVTSAENFISTQGFANVNAHANFYAKQQIYGANYTDVWVVGYASRLVAYSVYAAISQVNGTLLTSYNTTSH